MLKILFFDTETTGLIPSEKRRFEKIERYPRLLQISALVFSETGEKLNELDLHVYHKDLIIDNAHIHHITNEVMEQKGVPIGEVLHQFEEICSTADLIICHNYAFDSAIVTSELKRNKLPDFLTKKPSFCTMTEGNSSGRAISLQNLHFDLFGEYFQNHHNSLYDTAATARCFFGMLNLGWLEKKDGTYVSIKKPETFKLALDPDNRKFYDAFSVINDTQKNIFLTGKAGTGKTTFLKYLRHKTKKVNITLAYTGVAAINAGGQTINSFFQLPFRPFLPDDPSLGKDKIFGFLKYTSSKRDLIEKLDVLIIDEVSMIKADTLDAIDKILRVFRKKESLPFGGVQMIFIGDLFQLPPIEGEEWKIISNFYESPYFFDSRVIRGLIQNNALAYIELDKVYRQTETDFIEILNRIRIGEQGRDDLERLNQNKLNRSAMNQFLSDNYIVLTTTNAMVDSINESKLIEIEEDEYTFTGLTDGDFPDSMKIAPQILTLKVGAQVMLLKNSGRNYNGKIGKVVTLRENAVEVVFDGDTRPVPIDKAVWENIEYSYDKEKHTIEEKVKGQHTQFPLKLAWAVTVHKSQGLTFNKVIADVSRAFAAGQVYVALSRCTSLNTLKLIDSLPTNAIKIDKRVIDFSKNQSSETMLRSYIDEGKAETLLDSFRPLLLHTELNKATDELEKVFKRPVDIFSSHFPESAYLYQEEQTRYKRTIKTIHHHCSESGIKSIGETALAAQLIQYSETLKEGLDRMMTALANLIKDRGILIDDGDVSQNKRGSSIEDIQMNKNLLLGMDASRIKMRELEETIATLKTRLV